MGRLLTVTKDATLVEGYQYGPNGTRTYEMNALRGIAGRSMSYSDEDHLLTAGTATYQYDLDGFLTTKTQGTEVTTYSYSSRGELLSVSLPDGRIIDYLHDPLGRRIAKKVNGVITEKYLWQGLTRLLAVYDGSDSLVMRFEYADARTPLAMTRGGVTYYLTYDQVGSLRIVANSSGTVIKQLDYDAFGNILSDSNPAFDIPFGFAGGLPDRDTGLVRFGFRDYDPDVGRWTAKDPIGFTGGDVDLYGYVLNDPVDFIDPDGKSLALPAMVFVGVLFIGATYYAISPDMARDVSRFWDWLWKENTEDSEDIDMTDPRTWPAPPTDNPCEEGDPSRAKPRKRGEKSLYDEEGGEWRPHKPDKYHPDLHWDYKPPGRNSPWQDIPIKR
jgi:RHS repeat-associated protein